MSQIPVTETTLAATVRDIIGGPELFNAFTFVSKRLGFIYFAAPAVANTRTIGSLNLAVAERLGIDFELNDLGQIYNRHQGIIKNPFQQTIKTFGEMLIDPSVLKFTFVRDPAERFATVYRNMFSINTMKAPPRRTLFDRLGIPLEENLSMLDLAELLSEENDLKSTLPHLQSQRSLTAYDLVDYDFIGQHERWDTDYGLISDEIFGQKTRRFDPVAAFNQDPEGVEFKVLMDDETRAALETVYREDYDMLDEVAELFPQGFSTECL